MRQRIALLLRWVLNLLRPQPADIEVSVSPSAAEFQGIPLVSGQLHPAGAVLYLRQPSDVAAVEVLGGHVEVETRPGVAAVVVRGLAAVDAAGVLELAPEYANQALDLIALRGSRSMALEDVGIAQVTWWHDGAQQVARILATSTMSVALSASIEVRDASGNVVVSSPAPPPMWHESMRYFRMSQITDDLFDAFRNIYLALESVLSHLSPVRLRPNGRPHEGEGAWLKRALSVVVQQIDLRQYISTPGAAVADGVDEVYQELYVDVRTAIFHAKNGRPVLLPQDLGSRHLVAEAKERYTRLYLDLADSTFGARFMSGGFSTCRPAHGTSRRTDSTGRRNKRRHGRGRK